MIVSSTFSFVFISYFCESGIKFGSVLQQKIIILLSIRFN